MKTQTSVQGSIALTLQCSPPSAYAATSLELSAEVICDPPCDLTGDHLVLLDEDGNEFGQLVLTEFDEERNATKGQISLMAPTEPGRYTWHAQLAAFGLDELDFDEIRVPFSVMVAEHATVVNVWGAPSAVQQSRPFPVNIGVKCTCGCHLGGLPFTVHDDLGAQRADGVLSDDIWEGSEALHFAQVNLSCDGADIGRHEWEVRFEPEGLELPHLPSSSVFGVVVVPSPNHVVTVEAIDKERQTPLPGAIVSMHPYRASTDERGIAELHVPKGAYTMFVSARRYVSDTAELVVDTDLITQAQLVVEVRPERA